MKESSFSFLLQLTLFIHLWRRAVSASYCNQHCLYICEGEQFQLLIAINIVYTSVKESSFSFLLQSTLFIHLWRRAVSASYCNQHCLYICEGEQFPLLNEINIVYISTFICEGEKFQLLIAINIVYTSVKESSFSFLLQSTLFIHQWRRAVSASYCNQHCLYICEGEQFQLLIAINIVYTSVKESSFSFLLQSTMFIHLWRRAVSASYCNQHCLYICEGEQFQLLISINIVYTSVKESSFSFLLQLTLFIHLWRRAVSASYCNQHCLYICEGEQFQLLIAINIVYTSVKESSFSFLLQSTLFIHLRRRAVSASYFNQHCLYICEGEQFQLLIAINIVYTSVKESSFSFLLQSTLFIHLWRRTLLSTNKNNIQTWKFVPFFCLVMAKMETREMGISNEWKRYKRINATLWRYLVWYGGGGSFFSLWILS